MAAKLCAVHAESVGIATVGSFRGYRCRPYFFSTLPRFCSYVDEDLPRSANLVHAELYRYTCRCAAPPSAARLLDTDAARRAELAQTEIYEEEILVGIFDEQDG